ncbi:hypothetical protein FisN_7Hu110 [Fistulifera solaris]|uniref:Uncharacterized protein n=1 Tax=Fistulifera solaris TaxID=1519565 RepID=A0A1Z5K3H1_FISSO|nr:hypothetical protein FisN_7Hu110 [Fistulifera solaris]|eukprot:GAX20797.1 hypothetical protein FisN_7Hu110 [Fistulifera solaris]
MACWFRDLPASEMNDDRSTLMTQLRATKRSSKMQFYHAVHHPCNMKCLIEDLEGHQLVWLDAESFIVTKKLPKSVPYSSKFRKGTACIEFTYMTIYIYGTSSRVVALVTERFLLLKDPCYSICIGANYNGTGDKLTPTTFLDTRFLQELFEVNPHRLLVLGRGCYLSKQQSVALASHPKPLKLEVDCMFEDYGRAFVETLSQRTTDFGVLSLWTRSCFDKRYTEKSSYGFHSEIMSALSHVSLRTTSQIWKGSQCIIPLSSSALRLEYTIPNSSEIAEVEILTVAPKKSN